jgi:pimeloyl-ACP methyl ester carboxylesterase
VPSYASVVSDVVEVLDRLGVDRAAVIGWSGGGPHALACGALASQRVSSVTTVCSPSGPERGTSEDPEVIDVEREVLADPMASRDHVRARAALVLQDRTWATRMTERFDPTVFDAPNMRELFQTMWDEATAVSTEGYVDDWILGTLPWGFDLADVQAPSFVWFGAQDALVPRSDAEALTGALRHSTPFGCPDCRHYVPVAHWPQILQQVMTA